jgi:F0F1-type ATP synthase membrane subunit b/b'
VSISPGGADPTWRPEMRSSRSDGFGGFPVFVLVAFVVLFGATVYLVLELRSTRASLDQANQKIQNHEEQLAKLEGSVSRTYKQAEEGISALRGEVSSTRGQINSATKQVQTEVLSKTQEMTQRLSAEQKAAISKVGGDVEQLKSVATNTESKVGALTGEVTGVKSDVSSTKAELEKTIAELKSVKGDLGVQSGLVATNGSELAALKRLGERNYFEFDIKRTKQAQRVGNVSVRLKATDTKRNKYTVELVADDKLTEKKDRSLNEPVQFYVAKAKIPYEMVVNQVQKDRIVGYLATPKDQGR